MKTRNQLINDLNANPNFVTIMQAVTFNGRRVSINDIIEWAFANWEEFAQIAGIEEEKSEPVKKPVTSEQRRTLKDLITEANELCDENNRLHCLSLDANVKHTDLHKCPLFLKWARHDVQAYATVAGGKIICEASKSSNGWTNYYKHCFYFLKDGAKKRSRYSRAKALQALG